jgi:HlyD family secretion protein
MAVSRKRKIVVGSVVAIVLVGVLAASLLAGNREAPEVNVEKVKRAALLESKVTASGEVRPVKFYNLTAEVSGRITNIYVREGDVVKQNQELLRVDPTQLAEQVAGSQASLGAVMADVGAAQASLSSAENNVFSAQASLTQALSDLEAAKADLILADAEYRRHQQLLESGVVSRSTFDQAEARQRAAQAAVNGAQARVEQLRTQLDDARIRVRQAQANVKASQARVEQSNASLRSNQDLLTKTVKRSPIDGVVSSLPVKEGEFALANFSSTPLMVIADMSVVNVEVKVDETDIANVKLGQKAKVKVDAFGEQEIDGEVTEVGSSAITRSGQTIATSSGSQEAKDFKVVIRLLPDEQTRDRLRPGMSATAVVTTDHRENAVVVPLQALVLQEPEGEPPADGSKPKPLQGVFKLEGDKAMFVPLETGINGDTDIEVTKGIEADAEIITGPFNVLRTLKSDTVIERAPADKDKRQKVEAR